MVLGLLLLLCVSVGLLLGRDRGLGRMARYSLRARIQTFGVLFMNLVLEHYAHILARARGGRRLLSTARRSLAFHFEESSYLIQFLIVDRLLVRAISNRLSRCLAAISCRCRPLFKNDQGRLRYFG